MHITVAVPVHNGELFLEPCLSSAVQQSLPAAEILVVDDASGDCSVELCRSSRWEGKVRYEYNAEPTGFADAWNRCGRMAYGDYVTILHQDDVLEPDFLETMTNIHRRFPNARHLFCAADYIDERGTTTVSAAGRLPEEPFLWSGRHYASAYLRGVESNRHIHRCPGVITERKLLLEECTYRKEAGLIADDDFFYRVGAFTDVAGTGRPLAKYRLHGGSVSARTELTTALARDYLFQVQCYAHDPGLFSEEDRQVLYGLAVRFINQALYEGLLQQDLEQARSALDQGREMERLVPGPLRRHLPAWSRPLWRMARGGAPCALALATAYARTIHTAGTMRHSGKRRQVLGDHG